MNLISFANFNISGNQPGILPATEKDGKPEDFSAILNNIFVALQTANSPAPNFSSGFEQSQTVSDGGQNFVLSNNQILSQNLFSQNPRLIVNTENSVSIKTNVNQNILPTIANMNETISTSLPQIDSPASFTPKENLLSIPENFQPAPKLPTMQNVWTETRAIENLSNIPQIIQPNKQNLKTELPVISKDFEIVSASEANPFLPQQNYSPVSPIKSESNINPLQIFKNISNSIRENDLPKVKSEPVSVENNRKINPSEIPVVNSNKLPEIDSPAIKTEQTYEVVSPKIEEGLTKSAIIPASASSEEVVIKSAVLPFEIVSNITANETNALPPTIISENSEIKLPTISDLQSKTESPDKITSTEVLKFSVTQPKSIELETKTETNLEIKHQIEPDSSANDKVIPERQSNVVKLPSEPELKIKSEVVSEKQINIAPPNNAVSAESMPSFSVAPILNKAKSEISLPQPVSQNLDSQIVENERVKPQTEDNFVSEIIQPKFENTFIEETPKPFLTDDDLIGIKLPFEDSSALVSVESKSRELNPTTDKIIQSDLVEKTSIAELVKPNLVENKSTEVKSQIDAPPVFENTNLAETKVVKPKSANYLNDTETVEKNPIQTNVLPENQKSNQSPNVISNETVQPENTIKVTNLETSQNFNFNERPETEMKSNETENNLPVNFDKLIENAVKDSKVVETNPKNQIEPNKIAEQINPHLLELAALVEKKDEKEILKLRLHPAELGTVEITLERDKSGVLNAHFKTETADAQQALSNNLEQLRDNLQNAGWEVGKMDVSNGSTSTTDNQNQPQHQQTSEWIENFVFSRSSAKPDEAENNSPKRLLNLLA